MNIPEIYLIEPYNAYSPKGKKKHWMQEVDEQILLAKILSEQSSNDESDDSTTDTSNKLTTVGHHHHHPKYYTPDVGVYSFIVSPVVSSAPTTIRVHVVGGANTFAAGGAEANWTWGDGTTGNGQWASHVYNSTGSFDITLSVNSVINNANLGIHTSQITVHVPTVAAAFTVTGASVILHNGYYTASRNDSLTFVNGATTNNSSNPLTYLWNFTSETLTSTATNPVIEFPFAGIYPVTLGVSGSFNAIATGTRNICIT